MFENVKDKLDEIISISEKCPEKFQVKCFEILLDTLLRGITATTPIQTGATVGVVELTATAENFLSRYDISQDQLLGVFHFDGNEYQIIVKDLKEKPTSARQAKLALLIGLKNLLQSGTPIIFKDELMNMCRQYAAFDSHNFAVNMKSRKNIFLQKGRDQWELTRPGQQKAAEVLKELSQ